MAAKTDIWMPLYIGDYLAATTHLSANESGAYLHLLMHQWKNGSLPSSSEALRRIARVELDAWSNAWAVLQPFFDDATGSPVQLRLESIRGEWLEKKLKAKGKAEAAANKRWANDASSNAPSNAWGNAKPMHKPCPSSSPSPSQVKKEQKPLASTANAVPARTGKLLGTLPLNVGEYEVREDDLARDGPLYPGVDVPHEYRQMKAWLLANPKKWKTKSGIRRFMHSWLSEAQNKPKGVGNGTNRSITAGLGNRKADAADSALARAQARVIAEAGPDGGFGEYIPRPGGGDGRDSPGVLLIGPG